MRYLSIVVPLLLLVGAAPARPPVSPQITRGPYLQSVSSTATTLVLRTDVPTAVTLRLARRPGGPPVREVQGPSGDHHVFELSELLPDTRYYYSLAANGGTLIEGEEYFLATAPPQNSRRPFRFTAWGDSGTGNATQARIAGQLEAVHPQPEFALGLGDLVYPSGQWENYDPRFFQPYERLLRNTPFWSAIGNHDVETQHGAPYFDAFYLPTDTGAPTNPSGTESYYSFDYGMAHFVCVDSQATDNSVGGTMYRWIEDDLDHALARGKRWLIAYMHHPPYSAGTHNSATEGDLIQLRQNLVPLFEAKGVDLVLSGHSHVYERSFLSKDDAILQKDPREYTKFGSPDGTIYMVSGCGGQSGSGPLNHPLMATAFGNVAGTNLFDVSFDEIHGYFLDDEGNRWDLFAVRKAEDSLAPSLVDARATAGDELVLTFTEPMLGGQSPFGAEAVSNYEIAPALSVFGATLEDDQRTLVLDVSSMDPFVVYEVTVLRCEDTSGNRGSDRAYAVYEGAGGGAAAVVESIPRGATWSYFEGSSFPGADWMAPTFDDGAWSTGEAGFGYGDGDDATLLPNMQSAFASVYVRRAFHVSEASSATGLRLLISFDDGFVAFLNGSEVARANVPTGQTNTTLASSTHEAGAFEVFDLDASLGLLVDGQNVLAIEGHNASLDSSDFSLHPELQLVLSESRPPHAILEVSHAAANVPARVEAVASDSFDDGSIVQGTIDFGDGSFPAAGQRAEHVYDQQGAYKVTLMLTDDDGLQSIATRTVRVHGQGAAPVAIFAASPRNPAAGAPVDFDAAGSRDPDGGEIHYLWDFGDPDSGLANHARGEQARHAFTDDGLYEVVLTVFDDEGSAAVERLLVPVGDGTVGEEPGDGDDGGGGGGCYVSPTRGGAWPGDPSLGLCLALVFAIMAGWARRGRNTSESSLAGTHR